jgi:enamine deaminase RidA (YjgF/YER057c/UK114 family)
MKETEMVKALFTPCVTAGDLIFVSGQRGAVDGQIVKGGIRAEVKQALANLEKFLVAEDLSLRKIVKVTVYLVDLEKNVAAMNEAYLEVMGTILPARTTVGIAALTGDALVAIDVIARSVPLP